jgi:hypothetical protein
VWELGIRRQRAEWVEDSEERDGGRREELFTDVVSTSVYSLQPPHDRTCLIGLIEPRYLRHRSAMDLKHFYQLEVDSRLQILSRITG